MADDADTGHNNDDDDDVSPSEFHKSLESVDTVLSKELLQLSLKDRNAIDEEIHGVVSSTVRETPGFLEDSLRNLSAELGRLPDHRKGAYLESQVLPETYVNGPGFRLRFLRLERFDARKAALRMACFLEVAVELFGPVVLERPMRLSDFTREERRAMGRGNYQILPFRDQIGRCIYAFLVHRDSVAFGSQWKINFYLNYCMSDDIDTQRKGFISLVWAEPGALVGAPIPAWDEFAMLKKQIEGQPVRYCSFHMCLPDLPVHHPVHILRRYMALAMGKGRSRAKFHAGSKMELLYTLKTYGIPVEWIPITNTGAIKTASWKQWMQFRGHYESALEDGLLSEASRIMACPRSTDVVFRPGSMLLAHPGNAAFWAALEAIGPEHAGASQTEKEALARGVLRGLRTKGTRFWKWTKSGWWIEIADDSEVYARVAQKIRRVTKATRKQPQPRPPPPSSSILGVANRDNAKRRRLSRSEDQQQHGGVEDHCNCFCSNQHNNAS